MRLYKVMKKFGVAKAVKKFKVKIVEKFAPSGA